MANPFEERMLKYKDDNIINNNMINTQSIVVKQQQHSKRRTTNGSLISNNNGIIFGIDDTLMNTLCSYVVSNNDSIHTYSLNNLNKLLNQVSEDNFSGNMILLMKYRFLMRCLKYRLNGLSKDLIISAAIRDIVNGGSINPNSFIKELTNSEVEYIESTIGTFLNNIHFDSHVNTFSKLCDLYKKGDYIQKQECLKNIRQELQDMLTEFRHNDASTVNSTTRFRLTQLDAVMPDIHNYITNPANILVTGMQGMNSLLGGGYQKTKVYCYFGMSGEGKTTTLTNILYQVWKYNKNFKTTDPTKKPCIILFTMENLVIEYVCTLFNIITRGKDIRSCGSAEEVLQEFKERKFEYSSENDIEIVIDFKAVGTEDTSYCYRLMEELEDEGFETIAFFMDYLMRIKSINYTGDLYIDLGNIVNEFKTIAINKRIPFITASQLNREAARIIDEGRSKNQNDIITRLGRSTIGDSVQIDRNLDGLIILLPEVDRYGHRYMSYRLVKHRYDIVTRDLTIFQPFYDSSNVALMEDILYPQSLYKVSLIEQSATTGFINTNEDEVSSIEEINNPVEKMLDISKTVIPDEKPTIGFKPTEMVDGFKEEPNIEYQLQRPVNIVKQQVIQVHNKLQPIGSNITSTINFTPPSKPKIHIVEIIPKENRHGGRQVYMYNNNKDPY